MKVVQKRHRVAPHRPRCVCAFSYDDRSGSALQRVSPDCEVHFPDHLVGTVEEEDSE